MILFSFIIISESMHRYLNAAVGSYIIYRQHILLKLHKAIFRKYG